MKKVFIIISDNILANYFARIVKIVLPQSEIYFSETGKEEASLIILDSQKTLQSLSLEDNKKVIIFSKNHSFVMNSVVSGLDVILQSRDFSRELERILIKRKLV